jgi:hypothetical protein
MLKHRWTQGFFLWLRPSERNTLHPQEMFVLMCV